MLQLHLSEAVRAIVRRKGLKRVAAAEALEMSPRHYDRLVAGELCMSLAPGQIEKIAEFIGLDPVECFRMCLLELRAYRAAA